MLVSAPTGLERAASAGILAAILLTSQEGAAHLTLTAPVAREAGAVVGRGPNASLKQGPCGQIVNGRTDKVSVFAPGETIEVTWNEFVNHRSYYRVAFDVDADDDFPVFPGPGVGEHDPTEACPVDGRIILAYDRDDRSGGVHTLNVQLPDVECESCTLQVIQYMYDTGSPYYFQCADLALRRAGGDAGTVDGGNADAAAGGAGTLGSPADGFSLPASCTSPLVSTEVAAGGTNGMGAAGSGGDAERGSGGVASMNPDLPDNPESSLASSGARVSGGGCGLRGSASRHAGCAMSALLLAAAVGAARRRRAGRRCVPAALSRTWPKPALE
jgi:hypothetical protein